MLTITALMENNSPSKDLCAEHGLSLLIRRGGEVYLMDTGASGGFIRNAEALGVNLRTVRAVVISHAHADHMGGLSALFAVNEQAKVYIKKEAKRAYYSKHAIVKRYIGAEKGIFETYAERFVFFEHEAKVAAGFTLLSDEVADARYDCKDKDLLMEENGQIVRDDFRHECFAMLETREDGLVVVSSCSHAGIVNIVNTVKRRYPAQEIRHIVGGFHLMGFGLRPLNCTEAYVGEVADILDAACAGKVYTCHCTGRHAYEIMTRRMGAKMVYLQTGDTVCVGE